MVRVLALLVSLVCARCARGVRSVERVEFSEEALRDAVRQRLPIVFTRGTVADSWPALRNWSPESLPARVAILGDIVPGGNANWNHLAPMCAPLFDEGSDEASRELAAAVSSCVGTAVNQSIEYDVSTERFFERIRAGEPLLYIAPFEEGEFRGLEADVPGWRTALSVQDGGDPEDVRAMVWLGGAGVSSHTHYDKMHNLHACLHGSKTFELAPVSAALSLHHFSLLHPGAQKSAVGMASNEEDAAVRFPRFDKAAAFSQRATLRPGEVLYLPPFHTHRVVADREPTVTFSVWSSAPESRGLDLAMEAALPDVLSSDSPLPERIAAVRQLALLLLAHSALRAHVASALATAVGVCEEDSVVTAARFVREAVFATRFRPNAAEMGCPTVEVSAAPAALDPALVERHGLRTYAAPIAERLGSACAAGAAGIAALVVANYIEELVSFSLPLPNICAFFASF